MADISEDCCERILEESSMAHSAMMIESRANAQTGHGIVRFDAARTLREPNALEAAATEVVLKINPNT